ncbi:MAG: hypothetical protein LWY06_17435 [Firmicutes bacterium]|nr:hypothetical protein [Bacillota bacterium]
MILETTDRLKIQNVTEFEIHADESVNLEKETYSGDKGKVFDILMEFDGREARILLFDSEFGRNELLTARFIHGRKARNIYRHCCTTTAKVLQKHFPDVLGYVEKAKEHQILRAGSVMTLAPYVEGLKTQGDDFKRKAVGGNDMFTADATSEINWGPETTRIFSDICPASGSTMEAFVRKAAAESNLKKIIFNCSTSTINALQRVIPMIPENVEIVVIYWEALFSVWRNDMVLPDGEVIHSGTIINLNPDPDFPHCNHIAPREVSDYIHNIFQRDRVKLLPDIPGEVGEKIQDGWIGPLCYDILEFYSAGVDLSCSPWQEKARAAWEMPGVQATLKHKLPGCIYNNISAMLESGCCSYGSPDQNTADESRFALL